MPSTVVCWLVFFIYITSICVLSIEVLRSDKERNVRRFSIINMGVLEHGSFNLIHIHYLPICILYIGISG